MSGYDGLNMAMFNLAPGKRLRRTLLAAFFTLCFLAQARVGRALVVGATGDWDFGIVLRAALDFAADGAQGGIYFNNRNRRSL